ncbi:MAG: metalloregulator ArsR/SmtB family transcription factor [Planctomycetota bacterium]|nr:metalloregulator ArsR/SmtB family transcription factor [Planctomycetota bacterium]
MKRSPSTTPLTERLVALSELIRLRMCFALEKAELTVGELAKAVQLPQSTVSRHLKVLADAGFLGKRADGTATLYRLVLDDLDQATRDLWKTVSVQMQGDLTIAEDLRRVQMVLAERRTDSLAFFGRVAGEWDRVRQQLFGEMFTLRGLLGLLPPHWVVADLGCGTGNGAEVISPFVREVVAVDQSGPMLEAARKRLAGLGNIRFVDGPLEALPLETGSVDAAMCLMVLHHIAELEGALSEVRRVVRAGGTFLVVDMLAHDRQEYRHTMGHKHLGFAAERMRSLLEGSGFADVRVVALPSEADAKGPGLFAATGVNPVERR